MLRTGTGVQDNYYANQQVMVGVPNRPFAPTAIRSFMIDSEYAEVNFVPGETWVSVNALGFIVPGIISNSKSVGLVVRGASREAASNSPAYYTYEMGAVPVMTLGNCWINVVTAPTDLFQSGIAVNNETGKATTYDASATAGIFVTGEQGATLAEWQAVTDGSVSVTVDGGVAQVLTGLDFSAVASIHDVAAVIEVALTGSYVTYDEASNTFVFTSQTTGASSAVLVEADATGTSIFVADYLNADGGAATDGEAAGSAPAGYTALPSVQIEKWSAEVNTKVLVTFPAKPLTA